MAFKLSNIYNSLVRQVVDTIEEIQTSGLSPELEYYAWDSRGDEGEIDAKDLIGLAGWTFRENGGLWEIHVGITVSTVNDENLMREVQILDHLHDKWGEDCVVPLRDDAGDEYTQLVVKEFEMLASGQSEKRNYRPIGLTLRRTSSA